MAASLDKKGDNMEIAKCTDSGEKAALITNENTENAFETEVQKDEQDERLKLMETEFNIIEKFLQKCKQLLRPKITIKMYPSKLETEDAMASLQKLADIEEELVNDLKIIPECMTLVRDRKWKRVKNMVLSACMEFDALQTKYLLTDGVKSMLDKPSSVELANFDVWKECAQLRIGFKMYTEILAIVLAIIANYSGYSFTCKRVFDSAESIDELDSDITEEHIDNALPTRMAKQFCSLYDEEWTQAVEQILKTLGEDKEDNELIKDVSEILKLSYNYFKEKVVTQVSNMCASISKVALEPLQTKPKLRTSRMIQTPRSVIPVQATESEFQHILPYARVAVEGTTKLTIPILQKDFTAQLPKKFKVYLNMDKFTKLLDKWANFSWNVNLMDPPMVLLWPEQVNTEKLFHYFRYFTKFGTNLEFCVLPAVLLRVDGPVLVKGVAQLK